MNLFNSKLKTVERWFDGDTSCETTARALIATDPECAAYIEMLESLRMGAGQLAHRPSIEPAQFSAFMAGIHDRLATSRPRYRGMLTAVSAVAASLIAAISIFVMAAPAPVNVSAEVEQVDTFIEGAEVGYYKSVDGTMTVWVDVPEGDLP